MNVMAASHITNASARFIRLRQVRLTLSQTKRLLARKALSILNVVSVQATGQHSETQYAQIKRQKIAIDGDMLFGSVRFIAKYSFVNSAL